MDALWSAIGTALMVGIPFIVLATLFLPLLGRPAHYAYTVVAAGLAYFLGGWVPALAIVFAGVAVDKAAQEQRDKRLAKAREVIASHRQELAIRRAQLLRVGHYGVIDRRKWDQEIGHFIGGVLMPAVGPISPLGSIASAVRAEIEAAASGVVPATAFRSDLTPTEYEAFVAQTLRAHGWDAITTRGSGDQGTDVLATKGALRVVLQCKLYGRPVGNAAVQEAIAGREFERATHAAVVSNAGFTRAAEELAGAAGVRLLHHEQLPQLGDVLERQQGLALQRMPGQPAAARN